ncbi:MAG: yicI 7 [Bacteroidetes bacterium]|nr:yicI 7 [Bacteroidota bacterium]
MLREIYFPETTGWYDFYTGKYIRGGQKLNIAAPYERIPLFVREGAIIPFGPDMQYSNEKPADNITLFVYGGKDGSFKLYEDEGDNYNYEKGKFATIEFTYDELSKSLVIGDRKGEFNGMLKNRTFNVVYVNKTNPKAFDLKVKGKMVKYNGTKQVIKL